MISYNYMLRDQFTFCIYSVRNFLGGCPVIFLNTRLKVTALLNPLWYATAARLSKRSPTIFLQASLMRTSFKKVTYVFKVCFLKYRQKACGVRWATLAICFNVMFSV